MVLVIPRRLQVLIQASHEVRRLDRRLLLLLRAELRTPIPGKEHEVLNMRGQLLKRELESVTLPRFCYEAQKPELFKIRGEDVVGPLILRERVEVIERLLLSRYKIAARTLHFDHDGARNERVDKPVLAR